MILPAGTKTDPWMTGINIVVKIMKSVSGSVYNNDYKIESDDYTTGWNGLE
jgi:hypothetical protein